ncbi:GNAT family N-acetyltransferase [Mycobacteroides chelonae]|uniref:GNAT family N-acetyltransferase n=1 Tax=Mycobacteroides chelonae TaxID=1774 RepID=UPI003AB09752
MECVLPKVSSGLRLRRCHSGRLRSAYPVGAHDVQIVAVAGTPTVEDLCRAVAAVYEADPACRRVVFAPDTEDVRAIEMAQQAGFRVVIEVDIPGATVKLLVHEPPWVMAGYAHLDSMPGS